jgi:ABC-type bacteriocin/lantibiotic exporter with double-glycine peptidase domain
VNVRISYGYFHFFSGGHFLVMTNGDGQGVQIVDSSEYYIKYLPRDVLYSMFTGVSVVIVPKGYQYTVPNI